MNSKSIIPSVAGTGPASGNQQPQVFDNIPVQPRPQPPEQQPPANERPSLAAFARPAILVDVAEFEPHQREPQVNGLYRPKNLDEGEGEVVVLAYQASEARLLCRTANAKEEPAWVALAHFNSVFVPVVRTVLSLPVPGQKYAERAKPHNKVVVTEVIDGVVHFRNIFNARSQGAMDVLKFEDGFVPSK